MSPTLDAAVAGSATFGVIVTLSGPLSQRRGWQRPAQGRRSPLGWVALGVVGTVLIVITTHGAASTSLTAQVTAWVAALLAAVVDARTHRVPRRLLEATLVALIVLEGVARGFSAGALAALGGASGVGLAWWLVRVVSRGGLGSGDVVLLAMLGAVEAPEGLYVIAASNLAALLLASVLGLVRLLRGGRWRDRVPMAPAIALGFLLVVVGSHLGRLPAR